MSELMEKAKTEGISVDHPGNEAIQTESQGDVNKADSSTQSASKESAKSQPESAVKSPAESMDAESTSNSAIRKAAFKEAREWKQKYSEIEKMHREQVEFMRNFMSQNSNKSQSQPQQVDERSQAVLQLVDLLKNTPGALEALGFSKINDIEKRTASFEEQRAREVFDSEFDRILKYGTETFGLDEEELEQELVDYIENDPLLSQANFIPGAIQKAFRDLYWDRMDELKERAANLKLIKEQKLKKEGNTETPKQNDTSKNDTPSELDMGSFIKRRIAEGGGLIV